LFSKKYFWTDPKTYAVMKQVIRREKPNQGTKELTWWEQE